MKLLENRKLVCAIIDILTIILMIVLVPFLISGLKSGDDLMVVASIFGLVVGALVVAVKCR